MSRLLSISFIFIFFSQLLIGQKQVNSPYARFGPGVIEPGGTFKTRSMGGAGIALSDPLSFNYQNPASYAEIDTNSFVFDFGLDYQILILDNNDENYKSDDMGFHHIVMGFPLSRRAGVAFGLVPYSSGYYNIASSSEPGDPLYDPIVGETQNKHKGDGGYNKFFFGLGVSPVKNLSLGVNMEFLFGTISRQNSYIFLDGANYFNNSATESIMIRGYNFNYALQYSVDLSAGYFLSAGFAYTPKKTYRSDYEDIVARYSVYTGTIFSIDTLSYSFDGDATLEMPDNMTVGIGFGKKEKFSMAIDYTTTGWSDSNFSGYDDYLVNSNNLKFGIEFIPDKYANTNFLNRVEYRLGGHTSESHLIINNEQIKEFGITFGAGLPMNRSKSRINLFFEYGQRKGSFDNGLHKETYYNFGLSFNFYDNWFNKKQYN